ncbi:MAG: lipoyl synthase [candidate division KSB1 bacterium]|nr:lipoyl synthase [candidate division KSB1 bacterium]
MNHKAKPKVRLPSGEQAQVVRKLIQSSQLHTVCQSARCPNIGECWSRRTATFMIMGDVCTRNCRFCAVSSGKVGPLDAEEPKRVARAVESLGLKYVVVTSVTRDDLPDGGAWHFAETIREIRSQQPECKIEVLIPDFKGDRNALDTVFAAQPDVLNHNLETIERLYPQVRPQADYRQSLNLLAYAHEKGMTSKTGIMVGLGETRKEIDTLLQDVIDVNCRLLTVGQYLQPTVQHVPVDRYVPPQEFREIKKSGLFLGIKHIEAAPLVRSSYHADEQYKSTRVNDD